MSEEAGAGSTAETTQAGSASTDNDSSALDAKLKAARDDAAKYRIKAREASEELSSLRSQLAEMKATQAAIMKAAGLDSGGTDPASDLKAIEAKAKERERMAQDALRRADFTTHALRLGYDKDAVDDAYELAKSKGYLSAVDVDLETTQVVGTEDAAAKFLEDKPMFKAQDAPKPRTDARPAGGPSGNGVDLRNIKPGDIKNLPKEDFFRMLDEGVVIKGHDAGGRPVEWAFRTGGDQASHDVIGAREDYKKYLKRNLG